MTSIPHLQMDGYEMIEGHRPKRNIKSAFKRWSLGEDIKDRHHVKETIGFLRPCLQVQMFFEPGSRSIDCCVGMGWIDGTP